MREQLVIRRRRKADHPLRSRRLAAAFEQAAGDPQQAELAFPGIPFRESEDSQRTIFTGSLATLVHLGALGLLILFASLAPVIDEEFIPVQLLHEEVAELDEPAPAPRALAERRALDYAPSVQAVAPQVVNPHVIAEAVSREALQVESVTSAVAPTQIASSATVVERVSAVHSPFVAQASTVDVASAGGAAVRGPVRLDVPAGPSVGPRKVATASGNTMGIGTLEIGGSSVREGVISSRDVLGTANAPRLANVNVSVGEGLLGSSTGGDGTGNVSARACYKRPEVQQYMSGVRDRTLERWTLPPGVPADQDVTLNFRIDIAGSAAHVDLVRASDNALGASAVDALRAASPFPPMPERVRCLSRLAITATFSNPGAG